MGWATGLVCGYIDLCTLQTPNMEITRTVAWAMPLFRHDPAIFLLLVLQNPGRKFRVHNTFEISGLSIEIYTQMHARAQAMGVHVEVLETDQICETCRK